MMELLSLWLKKIILLILLATFVDLLLPSGTMQKYVKMVMGLLLLMTFLAPVFVLLKGHTNIDQVFNQLLLEKNQFEMISEDQILADGKKYQQLQQQLAIETTKKSIGEKIQHDIKNKFGFDVTHVFIGIKQNGQEYVDLELVHLEVMLSNQEKTETEVNSSVKKEIAMVSPVKIKPVEPVMNNENDQERLVSAEKAMSPLQSSLASEVKDWLKQQWSLNENQVEVIMTEGGAEAS